VHESPTTHGQTGDAAPVAVPDVSPLPDLPAENEEWRRLAHRAGNPFGTWEWASTWWRHRGGDREQRILGCRRADGSLAGVLPLYFSASRPVRTLRFAGHGPADQLGPVCEPGDREAVARAFRHSLSHTNEWDVCVMERLSGAEGWPALIEGKQTRREACPTMTLPAGGWEAFLGSRSAHFRQQVRRLERKLVREQDLRFRLAADPDRLDRDMDTLFTLHQARWGETTDFLRDKPFHHDLAREALAAGWLRLWIAELNGAPAAAWYGFRLGGADWSYQQGRDPAWEHGRIGFVMIMHTIRDALEDGIPEYRFLVGAEGYKYRLAEREDHVTTVAVARGPAGRAALAAARLRARAGSAAAGARGWLRRTARLGRRARGGAPARPA
jgi:CelD/BcsL family acetyltransferase involved in cellulose biosynthesis